MWFDANAIAGVSETRVNQSRNQIVFVIGAVSDSSLLNCTHRVRHTQCNINVSDDKTILV